MNYCNFAKVILSRYTKDSTAINWWAIKDQPLPKDKDGNEIPHDLTPSFNTTFSNRQRHSNYIEYVKDYPKMHLDLKTMEKRIGRIQSYLSNNKYWNTTDDKQVFFNNFSVYNWYKLPENEKKQHQLQDCEPCSSTHLHISSSHKSTSKTNVELHDLCKQVAENVVSNTPSEKAVHQVLTVLKPIMEEKLNINFRESVGRSLKLSPSEKSVQAQCIQQSRREILKEIQEKDTDNFLASGKSYAQYDRERKGTFFISKENATKQMQDHLQKENTNLRKKKKHHSNFEQYSFDKSAFLQELSSKGPGAIINWSGLARKYDIKISGRSPKNGGQILLEFARQNGIDVFKFNPHTRVSGRDYQRRVRRSIKKIGKSRISLPTPRTAIKLRQEVTERIESGDINVGVPVVPKTFTKEVISQDGVLINKTITVHAQKIPIYDIRNAELNRLNDLGILRIFKDDDYNTLTMDQVTERHRRIGEPCPSTLPTAINNLKILERTRHIKLWHDHSDILSHSYALFTVSWIYDKANFLTDEEFKLKFPESKPISVQSLVERQCLYLLGQSGSSDKDQLGYNDTRLDDIQQLKEPILIDDVPTYDEVRIFSGDGPARQYECGHQRGGNFRCLCGINVENHRNIECAYRQQELTLEERRQLIMKGRKYMDDKDNMTNPFSNLKKADLVKELGSRGVGTLGLTKSELQTELNDILKGIVRPPALMTVNPTKSAEEVNLSKYEIMNFEPLHDITNIVSNLITELPHHVPGLEKELEAFRSSALGENKQLSGSKARLTAVKLAKFIHQKYEEGKAQEKVLDLVNSLVEIISICYSREKYRTPKQILRFYNQTFIFANLCTDIIGNPCKLNSGRFYGSHFHTLLTHAPVAYRLICLRSVLTENEERSFHDLREISRNTTTRHCGQIITNAITRFQAQQKFSLKENSLHQTDSIVSKQSSLLPFRGPSTISSSLLKNRPSLVQSHLERIADFLIMGEGIWWNFVNENLVFSDGPNDISTHPAGPPLHHFRSSSIRDISNYLQHLWQSILIKFREKSITMPLKTIRVFENGKLIKLTPETNDTDMTEEQQESSPPSSPGKLPDTTEICQFIAQEIDPPVAITHSSPSHPSQNTSSKVQEQATSKELYKSNLKVSRSIKTVTPTEPVPLEPATQVPAPTVPQQPGVDVLNRPTERQGRQHPLQPSKRKLFSYTAKGTTADVIYEIVGDSTDFQHYAKYRRLTKQDPHNILARNGYEKYQAIMQTQVSKQRTKMSKKENPSPEEQSLIQKSEGLLKKMGNLLLLNTSQISQNIVFIKFS